MFKKLIECNKDKGFGMPTLIGRRLTVYDIITKIYIEDSIDVAIDEYKITLHEAKTALEYCKELVCQKDIELIHFCDGCILRTFQEGWDFKKSDFIEVRNEDGSIYTVSKNGKEIFFGSIQEYEDKQFGKVTWLLAEQIYERI